MTNIVFDIGNVLIAWDPRAAFRHLFPDDAQIDAALGDMDFFAWNAVQDAGRRRDDAVAALMLHSPAHAALGQVYYDRHAATIEQPIVGSWALLDRLKTRGHRIFMLTNWSADLFPVAEALYPDLRAKAEDIVVSGVEGLVKPQREIYDLLCTRNGLEAGDCFFIDDSEKNVVAARACGWRAHHFTTPAALELDLFGAGLL